jgi:hypothetical protein
MIDDINISTAIINNPQMKVEFNTNTQSTRLNRMRIGCFIIQEAGVIGVNLTRNRTSASQGL